MLIKRDFGSDLPLEKIKELKTKFSSRKQKQIKDNEIIQSKPPDVIYL